MSLHIYMARLKIIDQHISTKTTENTEILAQKPGLSIPGAYKFLKEMRDGEFPLNIQNERIGFIIP